MKKLFFTAAFAAIIFASCGNQQQGNGNHDDGMGAGSGAIDSTEEPMHPNDTTGMDAPVDTAIDTTSMP